MAISDFFLTLALIFAVVVVFADLCVDRGRRKRMPTDHRAWWERLRTAPYSGLMSDAVSGFYGIPVIGTAVVWRSRPFQVLIACVLVIMIAAGFLVAGASLVIPDPEALIGHTLNFFAAPSAVVALAWSAITAGLLSWIAGAPSAPRQLLPIFLLVAGAIVTWTVLMHIGIWFEWQQKRTPTPYGTEWFYAEAYMEYVREPGGRLISLTAALIIGLPAAVAILRMCFAIACKGLRPILAPGLTRLIDSFATARTGVYALSALFVMLVVGILGAGVR